MRFNARMTQSFVVQSQENTAGGVVIKAAQEGIGPFGRIWLPPGDKPHPIEFALVGVPLADAVQEFPIGAKVKLTLEVIP